MLSCFFGSGFISFGGVTCCFGGGGVVVVITLDCSIFAAGAGFSIGFGSGTNSFVGAGFAGTFSLPPPLRLDAIRLLKNGFLESLFNPSFSER